MSIAVIALALAAPATATPHQDYCVVQGDKLVPTGQASAANLDWFSADKPIILAKKSYVKYGFPQIMGVDELQFWLSKDSVPVMIKAGGTYRGIVYVQSSTTMCEFQPYRLEKP